MTVYDPLDKFGWSPADLIVKKTRPIRQPPKAVGQLTKLRQSLGTRLIAMAEQAYEAALTQAGTRVKGRARSRLSAARKADVIAAVDAHRPLESWLGAVGITELEILRGSFDTFATNATAEYQRYAERVQGVLDGAGIDVAFQLDPGPAVEYLVAALNANARRRLMIGDQAMLAAVAPRLIPVAKRLLPRARRPDPAAYDTLGLPDPEELAQAAARLVRNATQIAEGRAYATFPTTPDRPPTVSSLDVKPVEEQTFATVDVQPIWAWAHGFYGEPKTVFEPHDLLDGFETTDRESDPELANLEGWPDSDFYAPADHDGCTCEWIIAGST